MAAYEYIDSTGLIVADTEQTKTEVQNEYLGDFGSDLDLSDESPEGVLINAETLSRNGIATNNAQLGNQINPSFAQGVFLDAIMALYPGILGQRKSGESSLLQSVELGGVAGALIPSGTVCVTDDDNNFLSVADVTLDGSGLATVDFLAENVGAINVGIGELNTLGVGAPLGLETVNNPTSAIPGSDEETDSELRIRRDNTLSLQNISISEAVTSAVGNLDGVISLSFRENTKNVNQVIDGINLVPKSIYVCVDGGTDSDIALTLLRQKTTGGAWNGDTLVVVVDPISGQPYDVTFDRPAEIQTWIRVTIKPTSAADYQALITQSILDYANGQTEGQEGFVVDGNVSAYEISGAVNIQQPQFFVKLVEMSTDGIIYSSVEIDVGVDEVARTSAGQISVIQS